MIQEPKTVDQAVEQPVRLCDCEIGPAEVSNIVTVNTTAIELVRCTSASWEKIGKELKRHQSLREVSILDCDAQNDVCVGIADMKRLRRLKLVNCRLSDRATDYLVRMINLTSLDLKNNPQLSSVTMRRLLQCLRKLEVLELPLPTASSLMVSATGIGQLQLSFILASFTKLRELVIDRNNLGLVGAAAIARSLVDIEILNVDHNYLGAEGARLLVSSLAKLTDLKIDNNKIADEGTMELVRALPGLRVLNIDRNLVSPRGLYAIGRQLVVLKHLFIRNNNASKEAAKQLTLLLPSTKLEKDYPK